MTVKLHQNVRSQSATLNRASLESRITGASDAIPPRRRKPRKVWPAPSIPTLTRRFQDAVGSEKEKKIDTEGGMTPGEFPATAGSLYRVQSETPYTSTTCHPGVKVSFWRSHKAYAGARLCFLTAARGSYGQIRW
ncbi:TPA: hypothetical protein N3A08_003972 [Salmonella enterica subsp. salamae serovar 9,46:z4,z24:z39:z42]|nr:hypothetical protein [Salmonella enterica subsp. salamae serovar 9,46:z4,z24:z39:z42]